MVGSDVNNVVGKEMPDAINHTMVDGGRKKGRAVKPKKQGSRFSAFGYHTFLFQLAFDAGPYRLPIAIWKSSPVLDTDYCVQQFKY